MRITMNEPENAVNEYRVIVSMKVVNADGTPVDYRGYVKHKDRPHSPLECEIEFSDHAEIKGAHDRMNAIFHSVDAIRKLSSGSN